ncbi:hypothetical protein [Tenacibaculum maritimum]|uniref:hypothetical protein n=1 Tax=Tenacibaculum maritimum TaxID=107401 RepID=UPI0012E54EEE|nr:hypothetical protein [Tenacibaculum maritimum]CAA0246190.1 conserved hypothetical protein [Tenacibaculum maritimum]
MIERLIIDFFNAIEKEESITSKHGKAVFFIEELLERKNNKFSYIEKKKAIRLQEKYIEKKENVNAKTDPFLRDVMAQYLNYQDYEAYKASFISITQNNPSNPHTIKWYQKRINKLVIASSILFSLLCSFLMYQINSTHTTTCIVWKGNHFEKTSCHTPNAIDNEIYAINIKRFRKIKVIKGKTTFFKEGKAIVWYGKNKVGSIDFFTMRGIHPETKKELKLVTRYILYRENLLL